MGIGLTISQRLTERLGGRTELESEQGKGSIFTVIFPSIKVIKDEEWTPLNLFNPPILPNTSISTPVREIPLASESLFNLLNLLRLEERENRLKIKNTVIVGEIRIFARRMQQLAIDYPYEPLKEYADRLFKQITEFDLKILKTLEIFPEIVRGLDKDLGVSKK